MTDSHTESDSDDESSPEMDKDEKAPASSSDPTQLSAISQEMAEVRLLLVTLNITYLS